MFGKENHTTKRAKPFIPHTVQRLCSNNFQCLCTANVDNHSFWIPKQQKKFHGQHTFSHLSPVTNPLLCMPCSNTISVQNSTRNHTIQLSSWIKLLEILCASDAHFTLDCMYVLVSVRGRETDRERERERERETETPTGCYFRSFGTHVLRLAR